MTNNLDLPPFAKALNDMTEHMRRGRFEDSAQLSLGELIAKLEPITKTYKTHEGYPSKEVRRGKRVFFDFEYAYPTNFDSWRGSYSELALEFDFEGYGLGSREGKKTNPLTVGQFLKMCKETIGKEFTGWKGGEFVMTEGTPIWVSNSGNSGHTGVIDVKDDGYQVILLTSLFEY